MSYPLISEYVEAIKSAEDNFEELSYLRPVLGDDGLPVMTGGNFAVIFKMKYEETGNQLFTERAICGYEADRRDGVPCSFDGLGRR